MCICVSTHHIIFYPFICWWTLKQLNNAAVNMGYRYLFEIVILFPYDVFHTEVELLDHVVVLLSTFFLIGSSIPFSMAAVPVYIPTSSAQGFPFSTSYQHSLPLVFLIILIAILTDVRCILLCFRFYFSDG